MWANLVLAHAAAFAIGFLGGRLIRRMGNRKTNLKVTYMVGDKQIVAEGPDLKVVQQLIGIANDVTTSERPK